MAVGQRMSNAPVYYALAQAQFNPVAAMAKYVDQIQDQLRRKGYPLFETQHVTHLEVPGPVPGQAQPAEPRIAHMVSWLITKSDRTAGFILAPSAITYHTTHYDTHQEFIPELLRALEAVHEAASLDHISRLGLRYLNAVLPRVGETVKQYLVGGLHGVEFNATRRYTMSESVFGTVTSPLCPNGTLVSRAHRMTAPLGFPPDLQPNGLVVNPRFALQEPLEHAVIDADHYVEERMPLDMSRLEDQLLSLHATIKDVFRAMTTDHARNMWS